MKLPNSDDDPRQHEIELLYRRYLAEFGEDDSDIWVATYSKSGTTWMQLILYQLTTDGEMSFDHLFDVSPWLYYSALRRVAPTRTSAPRILKTHDPYRRFASGRKGRYVLVMRDGKDVCVSWYHHRRDFRGYEGSFDEHFEEFLHGREYNWFLHLRDWLENASRLPVLRVKYEELSREFDATVDRVSAFCRLEVDAQTRARTRERCSFAAMKQHERRLGPRADHFVGQASPPFSVKAEGQFIRRGQIGDGLRVLSERQLRDYRRRFDEVLGGYDVVAEYR